MSNSRFFVMAIALVISLGFTLVNNGIINKIVVSLMEFSNSNYQEKVYVQTDTDMYYAGDIIWLSTRLLDAQDHTPSKHSRVVHVKLFDSSTKELYHKKILINKGIGNADILLSDTLSTGIYHISGYTEWMKNFSQEYFFYKQIYIVNNRINTLDSLAEKKDDANVYFFPEGGTFIESMNNKVGFKIINHHGNGENGSGYIIDDRQDTVARVNTYKFGIGSFLIKPKKGRTYYLHLESDKNIKKYVLPEAKEDGVKLAANIDSLKNVEVELEVSKRFVKNNKSLILIAQCRGKVNFAAEGLIASKNLISVPRSKLRYGINQLTVFTEKGIPLAERLIFVQPDYVSDMTVTQLNSSYDKKSMVQIGLSSNFSEEANVTISVHDRPPMSSNNIINYLLLKSDLKGKIENPRYYFNDTDSARRAADNLMLTHGWRRFIWDDVLIDKSTPKAYPVEKDGLVFRGKLINKLSGKVVTDTVLTVSILNKAPNIIFYGISNNEEIACGLPEIYGKKKLFVNILEEENFNNLELVYSDSYDTFQHELPKIYYPNIQEEIYGHLSFKSKEKLILDNYRRYKPEMFSFPKTITQKDKLWSSQYLDSSQYELYPDKYLPLNNLKEMVFELIPSAKIKKKKGEDKIFVYVYKEPGLIIPKLETPHYFFNNPATFFVDGIPVFDNNYVFNLDYQNIYKVEVFNKYTFGFNDYKLNGIVAITTKDFELGEKTILEESSNFYEFEGLSAKREYYPFQNNSNYEHDLRIPDIRHLLYWNPNCTLKKDSITTISFRTSDVQNTFYVKVEGVSKSGKPLSIIKQFNTL